MRTGVIPMMELDSDYNCTCKLFVCVCLDACEYERKCDPPQAELERVLSENVNIQKGKQYY